MGWSDPNTQDLLDQVYTNESVYGITFVLDDEMIVNVLVQANKEEHGLKIQSKWVPNARATPVVPIPPDFVSEENMFDIGITRGNALGPMGFNSVTHPAYQQTEPIHDPFVRWKCSRLTLTVYDTSECDFLFVNY
jgi:hypothetical protein